ncbi:hypothetical protein [Zooshikella ganghwensis]|uniref:Uncharacterized protein n=1 Tax=Zooshikella ganghwensis TaxID=202772 RepID=A0A4P9VFV2_9GAMM|nr:hypothetical protein [Zooshikella ganghwensis]RDH41913.1 hypothetical protein B9G39_26215 [Zooshikella ganghwensis]
MVERKDLINPDQPVPSLISALGNQSIPWLFATSTGYRTLSSPEDREGTRLYDHDYPHAFVEPILGLYQYVPLRQRMAEPLPYLAGHWADEKTFLIHQVEYS